MRKERIALCDGNTEYAFKLEEYLRSADYFPFLVDVYTDYEKYKECASQYQYVGVVLEEGCEDVKSNVRGKYMVLSEEDRGDANCLYRYRPANITMQKMITFFGGSDSLDEGNGRMNHKSGLIGVYSPLHRCLQSSFTLTLGQILAKKYRVLYLSFEAYCVLGRWDEKTSSQEDMADLFYAYKNMPEDFELHLRTCIESQNGMDYVRPAFSYLDLEMITGEEWDGFLSLIRKVGMYDYILLDLSESIQDLFSLLGYCQRIYSIFLPDAISVRKKHFYEKHLRELHYEDVLSRTKWCKMPMFSYVPDEPEQLLYSEIADYIRSLLREETEVEFYGRE